MWGARTRATSASLPSGVFFLRIPSFPCVHYTIVLFFSISRGSRSSSTSFGVALSIRTGRLVACFTRWHLFRSAPLLLFLVAFPHQLLAALGTKDNLDKRKLAFPVLSVRERELERRQRRQNVVRASGELLVQRASCVSASSFPGPRQHFCFCAPSQCKLELSSLAST